MHIRSVIVMEQIFHKISVKKPSHKNEKIFWYLTINEATRFKSSEFCRAKSNMVALTVAWLSKERLARWDTKYLQMNNTGKNKILERALDSPSNNINVKVEYIYRKPLKIYQSSRDLKCCMIK